MSIKLKTEFLSLFAPGKLANPTLAFFLRTRHQPVVKFCLKEIATSRTWSSDLFKKTSKGQASRSLSLHLIILHDTLRQSLQLQSKHAGVISRQAKIATHEPQSFMTCASPHCSKFSFLVKTPNVLYTLCSLIAENLSAGFPEIEGSETSSCLLPQGDQHTAYWNSLLQR